MEVGPLGIISADDHRESVFKTQGLRNLKSKALRVELPHTLIDGSRIGGGRFVKDGGKCRSSVFDIKIEFACKHGFVNEQGSPEVGFTIHVNAGARFDVLSEKFGEYNLFRKKLRTDTDFGLLRRAAGTVGPQEESKQERKKAAHAHGSFS